MEFLPHTRIRRTLDVLGVVETAEGDRLRLTLREGGEKPSSSPVCVSCGPEPSTGRHVSVGPDRIGELTERLLHKAHIQDFALIPAVRWRPILDVIVFDLATNDDWRQVDADAALHQNTREPLIMTGKNRALVRAMLESLHRCGGGSEMDLYIVSLDAPFIIEVRRGAELVFNCPEANAENLVQHLGAA